ncbi:hypothetical protein SAMN05443252_105495 [Bacillus sp. OV322]|nr:hypothetical protein SAMN05443252_105495 [Bacillus sp. OV322]
MSDIVVLATLLSVWICLFSLIMLLSMFQVSYNPLRRINLKTTLFFTFNLSVPLTMVIAFFNMEIP